MTVIALPIAIPTCRHCGDDVPVAFSTRVKDERRTAICNDCLVGMTASMVGRARLRDTSIVGVS